MPIAHGNDCRQIQSLRASIYGVQDPHSSAAVRARHYEPESSRSVAALPCQPTSGTADERALGRGEDGSHGRALDLRPPGCCCASDLAAASAVRSISIGLADVCRSRRTPDVSDAGTPHALTEGRAGIADVHPAGLYLLPGGVTEADDGRHQPGRRRIAVELACSLPRRMSESSRSVIGRCRSCSFRGFAADMAEVSRIGYR